MKSFTQQNNKSNLLPDQALFALLTARCRENACLKVETRAKEAWIEALDSLFEEVSHLLSTYIPNDHEFETAHVFVFINRMTAI